MDIKENRKNHDEKTIFYSTAKRLLTVVQSLSTARDLVTIMDIVRHAVRDLTGSDGATFVLRDDDHCWYAEEDAISPLWKGRRFPINVCISGWVMLNREPAIIADIYEDSRIPIDAYRETFVKSLVTVPIKTTNPIGAIGCYWKDRHITSYDEINILQILADTAAISMDNINYQNNIAAQALQLEKAMDDTLLAIAKMVEQKDLYTSGHQQRVANIGRAIGEEIGLEKACCDMIYRAGVVHDIGKIGIPSELLSKPAELSAEEFNLIKTHSEAGYQILKNINLLIPIANIILQHHERLDGSGYPMGIGGDEILFEAQILSVADVFESMTSHRPYRPALGREAALEELITKKGKLYSPTIVDALVHLVVDKGLRFQD